MKIIVVGASGAVGQAAVAALEERHDIITVGRTRGDILIDVENIEEIRSMYRQIGPVDAVVTTIGHGHFGPIHETTSEPYEKGIRGKVMPNINLVLEGFDYMNDGGSFTLTTGCTNRDPIRGGACAASANGAIDSFVLGAAVDMPRGIRINAVSPEVLEASRERYDGFFRGHVHVSNESVGLAFSKAVEGGLTGQVFAVDR